MQLSFKVLKNHVPSVNVLKASALELLELAALLLLSLLLLSYFFICLAFAVVLYDLHIKVEHLSDDIQCSGENDSLDGANTTSVPLSNYTGMISSETKGKMDHASIIVVYAHCTRM